jgi:hypothetical protein
MHSFCDKTYVLSRFSAKIIEHFILKFENNTYILLQKLYIAKSDCSYHIESAFSMILKVY